jgi:hypothetical protein
LAKEKEMTKQISEERKSAYYAGTVLMIIGGILFASTFVSFATNFGNFQNFESRASSNMLRGICGMALLVAGSIIRGIGARGLAGSGVVLNPEKAREELEPYSRMAGGMVKDALDEAKVSLGGKPEKIIVIRCPACSQLNEDDAKFCKECGKKI